MNYVKLDYLITRRKCFCWIFPVLILAMTILMSGCTEKKEGRPSQDITVKTGVAEQKDVPVEVSSIGTVQAYSTVNITSRVDGQIIQVHAREGQTVEKGQILFSLDDRPFQSALESARSNLSRDRIKLEKAKMDARRYTELLKKDYVTKDQAEQAQTDFEVLEETIKGDEAALKNAELNISYCRITAPIAGRAGAILVNQGNMIKSNDSTKPMMVINQLQPVYIQFSLQEQLLSQVQTQLSTNEPKVLISLPDKPNDTREGRLTFLDNAIDANTGTIVLKATFDNTDNNLWPGQFVNVILNLGVQKDAVVVPSAAVQMGQEGYYIFMVKADNTVESRSVTPGSQTGDQTVIEKGMSIGETVVIDGQLKLAPGTKVSIKNGTQSGPEAKQ